MLLIFTAITPVPTHGRIYQQTWSLPSSCSEHDEEYLSSVDLGYTFTSMTPLCFMF